MHVVPVAYAAQGITDMVLGTIDDARASGLPSTGIPHVLVNGTVVVRDSKVLKDVHSGEVIRMPVQT